MQLILHVLESRAALEFGLTTNKCQREPLAVWVQKYLQTELCTEDRFQYISVHPNKAWRPTSSESSSTAAGLLQRKPKCTKNKLKADTDQQVL